MSIMDIFTTHEKQNRETITTEYIDYKEYTIQVDLIEYDLYERILVFRNTYRKEGIRIRAFNHDPRGCSDSTSESSREDYDPFVHDLSPVTKEMYSWRKEDGPSKSLHFNMAHGLKDVQLVLDEKHDQKQRVTEAIEHAKRCGFGD